MSGKKKAAVGLSGGVDSSVAAVLLQEAGYEISGLTMKISPGTPKSYEIKRHGCYGPGEEEDIQVCQALCARLNIPYNVVDVSTEYEQIVMGYFRSEYIKGRTPNPCVLCNQEIKFGFLLEKARSAGLEFDFFATGHYARVELRNGRPCLRTAADPAKDQSYFLYRLSSETLGRVLFPLGEKTKAEVRDLARRIGLETAEKPESQDFITGGDYSGVFEATRRAPGEIVTTEGKVLGHHTGIERFTIGQRRGIGVSAGPEPLYVLSLDAEKNRVVVGPNQGLFSDGLTASGVILSDPGLEGGTFPARVRIRQNHVPAAAKIEVRGQNANVRFEVPQRAVAPGQSAVFYDEQGFVVGGGIIDSGWSGPNR